MAARRYEISLQVLCYCGEQNRNLTQSHLLPMNTLGDISL